jgi:hypothetical protein
MSMSTISVVASERVVQGNDPPGDRMTPPRAVDVSRIEMRLLRDARRVLEYLSMNNYWSAMVYAGFDGDKR